MGAERQQTMASDEALPAVMTSALCQKLP